MYELTLKKGFIMVAVSPQWDSSHRPSRGGARVVSGTAEAAGTTWAGEGPEMDTGTTRT